MKLNKGKIYIPFIFLLFFLSLNKFIYSQKWVWTPESGWINNKYNPRENAKKLYKKAQNLFESKKYEQAFTIYQKVIKYYPKTPEATKSRYYAAECKYLQKKYYEAYLLYEEYLKEYPDSPRLKEILEKEYEIGSILIRGKAGKRSILGLKLLSTSPLGLEILEKLIQKAPYAEFADAAQLTIANYYFKKQQYDEAQETYLKLIKNYPNSEWKGVAQYQVAICALKQFRGIEYDPEALILAKKKLEEYIKQNPYGREIEIAKKRLKEINNLLGLKELNIALFYIKRGYYISAKIYLNYIIKNFHNTLAAYKAKNILKNLNK